MNESHLGFQANEGIFSLTRLNIREEETVEKDVSRLITRGGKEKRAKDTVMLASKLCNQCA
jgi:hypothetical protein